MEPYRKVYRRKIPLYEREKRDIPAAPAPLDKRELRALGYIGTGPSVEVSVEDEPFPFTDPPRGLREAFGGIDSPEIPNNIILGQE